jgi:hypothetical protein
MLIITLALLAALSTPPTPEQCAVTVPACAELLDEQADRAELQQSDDELEELHAQEATL